MKLTKLAQAELSQEKAVAGLLSCHIDYEIKSGQGRLDYTGPKFTPELWHQVLSFFRWTHKEMDSESQVRLYVNPKLGRWGAWAFPQEARTGMSAREIATPETPEQAVARFASWGTTPSADWLYFCTVHHHCSAIHQKLKQAHEMLGLINDRFSDVEQSFQAMSRVKVNFNRLTEYLTTVYPESTEPDKQLLAQRDRSWSEYFFDQGRGNRMPGVEGTLWAAFNGVTEWMDHRKTRQNENQRLSSSWFGETGRVKSRAYSVAMDKSAVWN